MSLQSNAVAALRGAAPRRPGALRSFHLPGLVRPHRPQLSIRARLAVWFGLIMTLVVVALSVAVIQLTSAGLVSELRRDVRQRTSELVATVAPRLLQGSDESHVLNVFSQLDVYCQVFDANGRLVASGSNLDGLRLPWRPAAAEVQRELVVGKIPLILDQQPVLAASGHSVLGYVIVGRSPWSIYQALNRLRTILYPGAAIAVLLGGVAGWLLVRRAIRPLERVGSAAAAIAASQDHARRVGYRGPQDEIAAVAGTIDDMLASLAEVHGELESAHASQRQFLLDVSHELRTPLTIMLSSLDVLARTGGDDPDFVAQTLADLRAEAERMGRMVSQLLVMARSQAKAPADPQPVLLAETLSDAARQVYRNGTRLVLDEGGLASLQDAVVMGNVDNLKQLFLILLDNAVKYTPDGEVVLSGRADERRAWVDVRDTGIGIPAEEVGRVFERFYRGSNVQASDGSGLGLAIAGQIAAAHGGEIRVASEVGRGSVFTVGLPLLTAGGDGD